MDTYYRNREHAGEVLASELPDEWREKAPVIVALPRGGVPVGYPIARLLNAPLDVLLVRKLGAPGHEEFALGAITEDGEVWMNQQALGLIRPGRAEIEDIAARAVQEMKRQDMLFRGGRAQISVKGRPVLLVDDGLATGSTMLAAVASMKARGASEIAVLVPVASQEAIRLLKPEVDFVHSPLVPDELRSIGEWYEDFDQVSDEKVVALLKDRQEISRRKLVRREVEIPLHDVTLGGELTRPETCRAWIVFAHGSGSSRKSPRNVRVARALNEVGFGTLLFDLLSPEESQNRENVFDVDLLAERLAKATEWLKKRPEQRGLPIGYFGASTGAAAALGACAEFEPDIFAIVSRGGRPDLAAKHLKKIQAPVLLIVGGEDHAVIELCLRASERLAQARVEIVPGASHLFEEPGALEQVTGLAIRFLERSLEKGREHHDVA